MTEYIIGGLFIAIPLWFLWCNERAYRLSINLLDAVHEYNQWRINNGDFKFDYQGNYDLIPNYDQLLWRMVTFRSCYDLITPVVERITR